jgi:cytidylate kinase
MMLENMELNDCIFRANHVSNYVNQAGVLNKDRDALVQRLKKFRNSNNFIPMGNDTL